MKRIEQMKFTARWLKNLRSNRYKQGRSALRTVIQTVTEDAPEYEYCCLGVAADEAEGDWSASEQSIVLGRPKTDIDTFIPKCDGDDVEELDIDLGDLFHEWTGLEFALSEPMIVDGEEVEQTTFQDYLAAQNDGGASFREIANIISKRATDVYGRGWQKWLKENG